MPDPEHPAPEPVPGCGCGSPECPGYAQCEHPEKFVTRGVPLLAAETVVLNPRPNLHLNIGVGYGKAR